MNEKLISIVTTLLLVGIAVRLVVERRRLEPRHLAFDILVLGSLLVAGASVLDVLDVERLGDPTGSFAGVMVFVERILGYMLGIALIGVGLLLWIPALAEYQQQVGARLAAERRLDEETELIEKLLVSLPGIFYVFDQQGRLLRWNRQFETVLGYRPEEIESLHIADVVVPEHRQRARDAVCHVLESGSGSTEIDMFARDGRVFPVVASGARVELSGVQHLLGVSIDVSDRVETERELHRSGVELANRNQALELLNDLSERLHRSLDVPTITHEAMQVMLRLADPPLVAVYLLDDDGHELRLAAAHGFDASAREAGSTLPLEGSLTGAALAEGRMLVVDDLSGDTRTHRGVRIALQEIGIQWVAAVPLIYQDRPLGSLNVVHRHAPDDEGVYRETLRSVGRAVSLAIANAQHVTDLEYRAFHDSLTGLPNRSDLHRSFVSIRHADYAQGAATALVLFDLDHFKEVNDALGHHVGDRLLVQIARRMQDGLSIRGWRVHRLGGDEFALLIPGLENADRAVAAARDSLRLLGRPFDVDTITLEVGASAGVAVAPEHGVDSHELLRCADVAMYQAKKASEGVALYDPTDDRHSPRRLELISGLGEAIRGGGLELHYQPKIRLSDGRTLGLEALVRWRHPDLGLLPPVDFIPLAEVGDLIQPLTLWVTREACRALRSWLERGHDLTMAVNLSTRSLLNAESVAELVRTIRDEGVDPPRVEFEITETALLADPETASQTIQLLHRAGARIAIDDFGTGYSALSSLRRFPVDTLKVDRSFVVDLVSDRTSAAIVQSVVALANRLGIRAVAEGVEDEVTARALRDMGCDEAQGYLFAVPAPAAEIQSRLGSPDVRTRVATGGRPGSH
jgi:diguanylate cyclase (GGDEF)-like protein/PAS domain S-box-containing protein